MLRNVIEIVALCDNSTGARPYISAGKPVHQYSTTAVHLPYPPADPIPRPPRIDPFPTGEVPGLPSIET
jgi:hypothetical protein